MHSIVTQHISIRHHVNLHTKPHQIKSCANMPYIRNRTVHICFSNPVFCALLNNAHPENTHNYQCIVGKRVLTDDQSGGFSHETGLPCSITGSASCASRGEMEGVRSVLTVPPGKYEMLKCPMCIKSLTMDVLAKNLLLQMAWKRFRDSSNRFCTREERGQWVIEL